MDVDKFLDRWIAVYIGKGWAHDDACRELIRRACLKPHGEYAEVVIAGGHTYAVVANLGSRISE